MTIKIVVEEEYGYRYWLWEVKTKTSDALKGYFWNVIESGEDEYWYCTGVPSDHFIGEWKQLDFEDYKNLIDSKEYDGDAHIHENNDSWIKFSEL